MPEIFYKQSHPGIRKQKEVINNILNSMYYNILYVSFSYKRKTTKLSLL